METGKELSFGREIGSLRDVSWCQCALKYGTNGTHEMSRVWSPTFMIHDLTGRGMLFVDQGRYSRIHPPLCW